MYTGAAVSPFQRRRYAEVTADLGSFGPCWLDPIARVKGVGTPWEVYRRRHERKLPRRDHDAVAAIVDQARPRDREAFKRYYVQLLSEREAAREMGIGLETLRAKIKRLRARARRAVAGQ